MAQRGRPKGGTNKRKSVLLNRIQQEFPEYHPIMEMIGNAHELMRIARESKDDGVRIDVVNKAAGIHANVAKYVEPQLKAVDVTVQGEVTASLREITAEEWAALAKLRHEIRGSDEAETTGD